jgi:hypothetical protein
LFTTNFISFLIRTATVGKPKKYPGDAYFDKEPSKKRGRPSKASKKAAEAI